MRTLKLTLAYDGTRFVGWQRQLEGESVQGALEAALSDLEGVPVTAHGAGRTDAGVHALGQVASTVVTFRHDAGTIIRSLNAKLPGDITVVGVEEVPDGFHARFSATDKTYRYVIAHAALPSPFLSRFAWHVPGPLDRGAMEQAAAALVGTHDFAAFQSTGTEVATTVRTLTMSTVREAVADVGHGPSGSLLVYEVRGDGFLRHMVRAIVGTLVEAGRGQRPAGTMAELLRARSRRAAGPTAPAHGLCLVEVRYGRP
ncbi:MAG: tRNA pseudouridine(38-40) synthase TruA [Acidimicrobiia bacterium]|nr:tRNA pseudouridine(38-40) synthase TruA [Acidimicrobiia bacterium]